MHQSVIPYEVMTKRWKLLQFLTRFSLQNSAELHRSRNDDSKQVIILMKALPVSVFTDVQRSLSPKSIADASFEEVKETLISLYYTQKSVLGSTIHFLIAGNNQVNRLKNIRVKWNIFHSNVDLRHRWACRVYNVMCFWRVLIPHVLLLVFCKFPILLHLKGK